MKKLVSVLAVLLLVPSVAMAAKWSSELAGATARQEGFASITTTDAGELTYTIMVNGIGVPNRAVILVGGSETVDLEADFAFGAASSTLTTQANLRGLINANNVTLRVEGPDGTIEGPVDLLAGADINVNALQRQYGDVPIGQTAPARNVVVTNDGTASLRVANLLIRGAARAQYDIVSNTCRQVTLPPGGRCAATITFTPTAEGEQRALALVNSSDEAKRQVRVQLRGAGI